MSVMFTVPVVGVVRAGRSWWPAAAGRSVIALALIALMTACGGSADTGAESETPTVSPSQTDTESGGTGATAATPLGPGELIVFEKIEPGAEQRDLYVVGPDGGKPALASTRSALQTAKG
ncbi:hypothetical protein L1785_15875 [Antribacter sp. KLBMP9083]|uniref:Uncharacterized protein n=1 Tax=Antribacter soli TaxID=2910976 RepID=A0AA41QHX7_9MICO|nr:hypothetical protein [Antribacter soli]MCF4122457.1 hypothetical protein [Antribacter soli]